MNPVGILHEQTIYTLVHTYIAKRKRREEKNNFIERVFFVELHSRSTDIPSSFGPARKSAMRTKRKKRKKESCIFLDPRAMARRTVDFTIISRESDKGKPFRR